MIKYENYKEQLAHWPRTGRHILAQYDDDNIVVYQAFRSAIALYAIDNQKFGGEAYSFSRMTWIKPNFLWMMYRSGWGTKEGQEYTLAITIPRNFFDELLAVAAWSSFKADRYDKHQSWENHKNLSDVRLQWDPDHDPHGGKLERRAIQLGLKQQTLDSFNKAIVSVEDLSPHVAKQKDIAMYGDWSELSVPKETIYTPGRADARGNVLLSEVDEARDQS